VKKDYVEGMADTFDLVVMGAYYGHGKRWSLQSFLFVSVTNEAQYRVGVYGSFMLGVYDDQTEEYQTMCKVCDSAWVLREGGGKKVLQIKVTSAYLYNQCMTGFTDEFLLETAKFFNENDHVISKVIPTPLF